MDAPSTPRREHVEIDRDRVLDDELEVAPDDEAPPERLDLPLDTPEPDAIDQHTDVPTDDDDYR